MIKSGGHRDETDKQKFYEGASWFGQQAVDEVQQKIDDVKKLRLAFDERKKECEGNQFMEKRNVEWLIEQQEKLARDTKSCL